jgi:hypothetical protein
MLTEYSYARKLVIAGPELHSSHRKVINSAQARHETNGRRVVFLLFELGVPSALVDWIVA